MESAPRALGVVVAVVAALSALRLLRPRARRGLGEREPPLAREDRAVARAASSAQLIPK